VRCLALLAIVFLLAGTAGAAVKEPICVTPDPPIAGQPAVWTWMSSKGDQVDLAINCADGGQYGGMLKSQDSDGTYTNKDLGVVYPSPTHCTYTVYVYTFHPSGVYSVSSFNGEFDVVAP